jgi:predicted AAA+ superfamily ATPase
MQRKLSQNIVDHLPKKEFSILTGARQTGKSTILHQLQAYCEKNNIPNTFLDLEDKSILEHLDLTPKNVFSFVSPTEQKTIVFVDEIQYLKDPSNFLKFLYDNYNEKIKIVASGSSAFYMDDNFKDSLSGRKKIFTLRTCSFLESMEMSANEIILSEIEKIKTNKIYKSKHIEIIKQAYFDYMLYGGYPAVVTEKNTDAKISILAELRDSFVKRDILESGVKNENGFYALFRILASQAGNLINVNELSNTLKIKIETINNYLSILTKCFHISLVTPFSKSIRNELTKMPKVYLLDNGMLNALMSNFSPLYDRNDIGQIWENTYFGLLCEKHNPDNIHFWRTASGNEVDFVVNTLYGTSFAFEVKASESQIKEKKYTRFRENYPEITFSFESLNPFNEDFVRRNV